MRGNEKAIISIVLRGKFFIQVEQMAQNMYASPGRGRDLDYCYWRSVSLGVT